MEKFIIALCDDLKKIVFKLYKLIKLFDGQWILVPTWTILRWVYDQSLCEKEKNWYNYLNYCTQFFIIVCPYCLSFSNFFV